MICHNTQSYAYVHMHTKTLLILKIKHLKETDKEFGFINDKCIVH